MPRYRWNCSGCNKAYGFESPTPIIGVQYECEGCHTLMLPIEVTGPTPKEQIELLGTRVGGAFSQGKRMEKVSGNEELKRVTAGGYCEGVALDWLRRVLQGGHATFDVSAQSKTGVARSQQEIAAREESQTLRAGNMWTTRFLDPLDTFLAQQRQVADAIPQAVGQTNTTLFAASESARRRFEQMRNDYNNDVRAFESTPLSDRAQLQVSLLEKQAIVDDALRTANELARASNRFGEAVARNNQPQLQKYWQTLSAEMDRYEQAQRAQRNRNPTKRTFSSLSVVFAIRTGERDSVATCLHELLNNANFTPQRGAVLGIAECGVGKTGHAWGIYRLNIGSKYHLLDPNLGVWEVDRQQLIEILCIAATDLYHFVSPTGKVQSSYTIFTCEGGNAAVAAPAHAVPLPQPQAQRVVQNAGPRMQPVMGPNLVTPPPNAGPAIVQNVQRVPFMPPQPGFAAPPTPPAVQVPSRPLQQAPAGAPPDRRG